MLYDSLTIKPSAPVAPISKSVPLTEDLPVQRSRKIHLIINGIIFVFALFNVTSSGLRRSIFDVEAWYIAIFLFFHAFFWTLLSAFGLFAAYHYYEKGLRVYGWILAVFLFIYNIITIAFVSFVVWYRYSMEPAVFYALLLYVAITFILLAFHLAIMIFLIRRAFKLARQITENKNAQIEQI
ncbi:hypothetical protein I4U23_004225 [Adineta vaga]|nr:hypothetical protein I4U23_004225 [Adineta vaga]